MLLYDTILKLCEERSISIAKLEKECGFGNATIRGWVTSSPSIANLQKVAEYFGTTVSDLIGEKRGND